MFSDHRVAKHTRIAAEIACGRTFEDFTLSPAITVPNDVTGVKSANVIARRLGDDVVKGGVDQVMPLCRQRRLGSVVFDLVRSPKNLDIFLFAVAPNDA